MNELPTAEKTITNPLTEEPITVTGVDLDNLPTAQEHEFYQEGSYLKCKCHAYRSARIPAGKQLVLEGGAYRLANY